VRKNSKGQRFFERGKTVTATYQEWSFALATRKATPESARGLEQKNKVKERSN